MILDFYGNTDRNKKSWNLHLLSVIHIQKVFIVLEVQRFEKVKKKKTLSEGKDESKEA